jgi:tripartite-type tricarboxylate transporter receptor subunit TctC
MPTTPGPKRRLILAAAALAAAVAWAPAAFAQQAWPSKPIRLIIPFAAGGGTDPIARAIATKLSARLGQPFVVENKGGAGGTLGTDAVAKAPADGYTLLFASTSITTNVASGKKLSYDLVKDLEPIGQVGASPLLIAVPASAKATTLRDLLDAARAKPRTVTYGSGGIGAISHLGIELLANEAKVQFVHVPYRGIAPASTDLIGGGLEMLMVSPSSATQIGTSGRIRIVAVTTRERSPFLPGLPTVVEAGVPGFQLEFWWGLLGPAGMPPAVVKRLNEELNAVLALPEIRELLGRESAIPTPGKPQDFSRLIASEIHRWSKLVRDANIRME